MEASMSSEHDPKKGLHWLMAAVFVFGDVAGNGMIALPNAIVNAGLWPGITLLFLSAVLTGYNGYQLASNFNMMKKRWSKYAGVCRKPLGEMGFRAYGPGMRKFVTAVLILTQFGASAIIVILGAKNVGIFLEYFFSWKIHKCFLIISVGFFMWPFTMLQSPLHFWQMAVFSAFSTSCAAALIAFGMSHDAPVCAVDVHHRAFSLEHFCMSFGTIVFCYGGAVVFPTIQHDMKEPKKFKLSILLAYIIITGFYFTQSVLGYSIYGNSIGEASIQSVQLVWVQQTVNLMIGVHVITTMVIKFSPIAQQIEELFKISHSFGWQRFILRSSVYWLIVFICLSLPHFGPLLDLIGASMMTTSCLILPSLFYLSLQASWNKRQEMIELKQIASDSPDNIIPGIADIWKYNSKRVILLNAFSLAFGLTGGIMATITSVRHLFSAEMGSPCYVQYFKDGLKFTGTNFAGVNCCGSHYNVTVSGIDPHGYCSFMVRHSQ